MLLLMLSEYIPFNELPYSEEGKHASGLVEC